MATRVLVTGACGKLGTATVQELVTHGYEVVAADRVQPRVALPDGAWFVQTDLLDVGQVAGVMAGCAAVVHLGAIPVAYTFPNEVVFRNNTGATYATLQAASLLGVKRAAIASSASIYGTAYAPETFSPHYAPVDEAHPLLNHDPYGVGKEVDERVAEMFCRRDGMTVAALRFHWIATPEEQQAAAERYRQSPESASGLRILWGYVDLRDAARACRLALEAEPFGFAPCNIVAADMLHPLPTEEAIRRYAPQTELQAPLPGFAGAFAIDKAKRLIGWEPQHSWRQQSSS
jgi:nucleoside-diphosphate-sugar epimerase